MKTKLDEYLTHKALFKSELKAFCHDKSIPLDERWDAFIKSELGEISPYSSNCKIIGRMIVSDEIDIEKYSTHEYNDIIKELSDQARMISIQEYALEKFEKGFTYDW